jgi:two-component system, NtrC family, response regulator AtoC
MTAEDDKGRLRTLEAVKREHVERVLAETGGNKTRAAKILGITRRTMIRIVQRLKGAAS